MILSGTIIKLSFRCLCLTKTVGGFLTATPFSSQSLFSTEVARGKQTLNQKRKAMFGTNAGLVLARCAVAVFAETYMTSDYLIVDKPHDLCINGDKELSRHGATVASLLSRQRPDLVDDDVCYGFRFPHQLDYATSGVLCITLNKKTTREASKLFKEGKVEKEYLAVVRGHVTENVQVLKSVIGQDISDVTGFAMTSDETNCQNPKPSETRIQVLARSYIDGEAVSKLVIQPITGRRHQIRVHCLKIGHPILGDYTYSGKTDTKPHRMMLHAWKLKVPFENNPVDVMTADPFS